MRPAKPGSCWISSNREAAGFQYGSADGEFACGSWRVFELRGCIPRCELSCDVRDLIAVAVAQASGSDYALSAVCALAQNNGRSESELAAARVTESEDPRTAAALRFAAKIVERRGHLSVSEVGALREVGFSDGEVAEIIASVVLNIYRSYFNLIARPEIDFPVVKTGNSRS
jgi:alkylhydroperoxidase family enzyme